MDATLKLVNGWRALIIRKRVQWFIIEVAFMLYRNPFLAFSEMKRLRDLHRKVHGNRVISKYIQSGNQFFWNSDYCGFPSNGLNGLIHSEFIRNLRKGINQNPMHQPLQTIIWGITNRCSLSCEHCYEWENIAKTDQLDLAQLKQILAIFRTNGIRHIQFSGGEPLVRFNDLAELVRDASKDMDCWILSSGYGLTREKAKALKVAGLTGVNISLDHWNAHMHNNFRNNESSYEWVMQAVRNCLATGIIVSLSLCATRDFVTDENLLKYAMLAKNLGVHFIRILEPRAIGKYSGKDVQLNHEQVAILSDFTFRMNSEPKYKDFPIFTFMGYHQRKMGCFGAGNRFVYADPNGDVHACPFCRGSKGNLLEVPFGEIMGKVRQTGCFQFENYEQASLS